MLGCAAVLSIFVRQVSPEDLANLEYVFVPEEVTVLSIPFQNRIYGGFTVGRMVVIAETEVHVLTHECKIAHELVHVSQYARLGYFEFAYQYVSGFFQHFPNESWYSSYKAIGLEEEAMEGEEKCLETLQVLQTPADK